MKTLLLMFFLLFGQILFAQTNNDQETTFSVDELKVDIKYLKNKIESNHPSLYLYTSKSIIDKVFDSLENSIIKPMTALGFYKHISFFSSIIKDGHTIILPSAKTIAYHTENSRFLPYHFTILDNQLYIDMGYTNNQTIPAGAAVSSINGVEAGDLIKQLCERQVRDGNNLTYPLWIISNYFRQYYSFVFGHPDYFTIRYTINGQTKSAKINALTQDSIYYYRQQAYLGKIFSPMPNEGLQLMNAQDKNYAVLTIKDFHNDVLRKVYKQNFEKVISSYFEQIHNSKIDNLIIDLRNNQGGDIENGVWLLSYLLDKPFTVVQEYFNVVNNQLQKCNGPSLGLHRPKSPSYQGKLYVLINGGSFSNSGIVSSCLLANNRAIFIGQETGGNPNVIAGFIKEFDLPNSKIQVQIPTKQFVITDKTKNNGNGIIPNKLIAPTIADVLAGKDTELDYTIELIRNKNKER